MRTIARLLPHVAIILSGIVMVIAVFDRTNPSMGYLSNDGTRAMLFALCITSIANAVLLIGLQRRSR